MQEYIITCRSREELIDLYDDMETPGGSLYIPDRAVELVDRRAISRNTHYLLTEEEAEEIRNDPRVIACERPPQDRGLVVDELWEQTGDFEKTTGTLESDDKNWGLWRVVNGRTYTTPSETYDITTTAPGGAGALYYYLTGTDRNGVVDDAVPTVTLTVGDTVNFNLSSVDSTHPFYIRVSNGGANVSTPPATGQGSTGNATVSWTPNTAGTYYYQCGNHPSMIGTITVNQLGTPWGSDNTTEISNQTIRTTASGKNVDVVIVDSHVNPDHPEFAVNVDGTGGSRVNQINWFQYKDALGYSSHPSTYTYSTSGSSPNSNHGTHVCGTACGNTQGWARDANIYNMAFSDTLSGVSGWTYYLWDYLRYFHLNKDINPETGRRNPTITNHSWGYSRGDISTYISSITSTRYRNSYNYNNTKADLEDNGIPVPGSTYLYRVPVRVAAVDADIQDAIEDGVIIISSAGNSYWNCDVYGGDDYNNYYVTSSTVYHSRGSTPGSADDVICVGSMGSKAAEYKSNFSNWGARVDIWAPGSDIISAVYDYSSSGGYGSRVADPRNGSYWLASINGTSMASPQVCGVVACIAETEQNLTQAEALQYLKETSKANCGDDGGTINHSPYETFGTSNNRYLFITSKRQESGSIQPTLFKNRNPDTAGVKYPRRNTRVTRRA
jgi:plastocyanin